ncbi:MAG: Gfo/Idh/MocA family oxidoreductase [Anaerolineae bacterium]|nr:Gfo/Idh/MocA family oxidoreductase [Anaerolineae bacterium]
MRDLKIGVIGSGGRGSLARYAHRPQDGSRVVACCDANDAVFERNKAWYGDDILTTTDYRELLAQDLDAVFVTTPDYLHKEHAVAALQAGKAVYLEKPMAITIAGCDRILQTARDNNAKLYLGHNMRHFDVILKMKELIDEGAIGQVKVAWCRHFVSYGGDAYFKDWHADRRTATGLLLQKGAHDIDILHWLCGGYTKMVTAMGGLTLYDRIADRHDPSERGDASFVRDNWPPLSQKGLNPVIDVEDISMMLMKLDNGVLASYQQCHYTPDAWRNYTIIGSEGRIENFGDGIGDDSCVRLWNTRSDRYSAEGDQVFHLDPKTGGHGGGDPSIVAEFLRYVREGGAIKTSPVAARYSVAAGCMATESLRNGSVPMAIPPLSQELIDYFQ